MDQPRPVSSPSRVNWHKWRGCAFSIITSQSMPSLRSLLLAPSRSSYYGSRSGSPSFARRRSGMSRLSLPLRRNERWAQPSFSILLTPLSRQVGECFLWPWPVQLKSWSGGSPALHAPHSASSAPLTSSENSITLGHLPIRSSQTQDCQSTRVRWVLAKRQARSAHSSPLGRGRFNARLGVGSHQSPCCLWLAESAPNMALEATGHSAGFFSAWVSVGVARASAWALGRASGASSRVATL